MTIDPKSPQKPISRLLYGLAGGLLTGIADSAMLLTDENGLVPFVHIVPSDTNICESFQLSYKDHLRGMLLYITIGKILNPGISCKQIPFSSPSFPPLHTVRETFTSYGVPTSFYLVNSVRLHLLRSSLSFLICCLVNCNNF